MKLSDNHATHGLQGVLRSHQTGQEIHFNFPPGCSRLPVLISIGGYQIEGDLFLSRREGAEDVDVGLGIRYVDDKVPAEPLKPTIQEPPPAPDPIATKEEKAVAVKEETARKAVSDFEAKDPGFETPATTEESRDQAMSALDYHPPQTKEAKGGIILEDAPEMEKDMLLSPEERASGKVQPDHEGTPLVETSPFKPPETTLGGFQAAPVPVPVSSGRGGKRR